MLNAVEIAGRLTREPDIRYTSKQTPVASFSIAVDDDIKGADGSKRTQYIDIVAWRNTAEFIGKYIGKGDLIAVTGRLQVRDWEDKNGNKRRNTEVLADHVYIMQKKGAAKQEETSNDIEYEEIEDEGELPF